MTDVQGELADSFIEEADLRALVRLLGEAASLPGGLQERRGYLLDGRCDLVGAAEWRWEIFPVAGKGNSSRGVTLLQRVSLFSPSDGSKAVLEFPSSSEVSVLPQTSGGAALVSWRSLDSGEESGIAVFRSFEGATSSGRDFFDDALLCDVTALRQKLEPSCA